MPLFSNAQLRTDRLDLRPLCLEDAESLFRIYSDPEFTRYWSTAPWASVSQATALIEKDLRDLSADEALRLGIFLRGQNVLIGTCSLFHVSKQCRRAEVGYGIAPAYWRQGYMFEAVSAILAFAFEGLGLNRLEADIDPRNVASARSLEKLGFLREGLLPERWIVGDEISDSALYGLLARDWKASHGGPDNEKDMTPSAKLSALRQIAITVSDVEAAVAFYHGILGLDLLFRAGPNLAFLDAAGVRIMLSMPEGAGTVGGNSILYFSVSDIISVHDALVRNGATSERAPSFAAQMPDHELWTGFLRDPDGNLVGLMEEKRG